jgi:hypothetical protein
MLIDHFRSSNSKRKGTETQRHFSSREDALDKHVLTRVVANQIIPTWYTFISNIKNKYGYNNYRKMIFRVKSLTPIHHMYKQPIVSQNMRSILHVQKKNLYQALEKSCCFRTYSFTFHCECFYYAINILTLPGHLAGNSKTVILPLHWFR